MMAYMKKHGHRESDMNNPIGNHGKPVTCWKRDCLLRESVINVPVQKDNRRNEYSGMSSRCCDIFTCRSRIARDYKKEAARCKKLQSVFNELQFEWADKSTSCTRREREIKRVKNMGVEEYLSHVKTLQATASNTIDLLRPSGDYNLDAIQSEELHSVFTDTKLLRLYVLSKRANEDFLKMEKLMEQGDNSNGSLSENEEKLESCRSSIKEVWQMGNATPKLHKSKEQYSNVCQRFVEVCSDSGESSLSSDNLLNEIRFCRPSRKSSEDPIKLKRIRNFINSRNSCLQETSLSGSIQGGESGQSSRKNLKLDVYRNENENCTRRRERTNCRQTILTSIKRNDSMTRLKSDRLQDEKEVSLSKISLSSGICSMKSDQLESSCSGSRCSRTKSPQLSKCSLSSGICSMKSEQLESSCSESRCSRTKSPQLSKSSLSSGICSMKSDQLERSCSESRCSRTKSPQLSKSSLSSGICSMKSDQLERSCSGSRCSRTKSPQLSKSSLSSGICSMKSDQLERSCCGSRCSRTKSPLLSKSSLSSGICSMKSEQLERSCSESRCSRTKSPLLSKSSLSSGICSMKSEQLERSCSESRCSRTKSPLLSKSSLSSGICSKKSEQLERSCSGSRCSRTKCPLLENELSSRGRVSVMSTESTKRRSWRKNRRLSNNPNVPTGVSVTKSSPEHSTLGFNSSSNSTLPSTNGTTSVLQSIFSSEYVTVNESLINFEPQKSEPQKNTSKLDDAKLEWIKNALRIAEGEDKGIRNNMCKNKDKKKETGRTLGEIPLMERGQVPGYVDVALQRWLAIKRRHIELKHQKSFSNRKVEMEDQKFARRCDKAARRILEELEALILRTGDASPLKSAGPSEVVPPQPDQGACEDTTRTPGKRQRPPRHRSRPSMNYNKYNSNNKKEQAPPSRSNSAPPKCNLVVRFSSQNQEIILPKDSWSKLPQESSIIPPYRPFCPMELCPFSMTYSEVRPSHEIKEITQGIPDESK